MYIINVNGNLLLRERDLVLAYTVAVCVLHVHQWHVLSMAGK